MLSVWKRKALRVDPLRQDPSSAQSSQHGARSLPASSPPFIDRLLSGLPGQHPIITAPSYRGQLDLCTLVLLAAHRKKLAGFWPAGNFLIVVPDTNQHNADELVGLIPASLNSQDLFVSEWQHLTCAIPACVTTISCLREASARNVLQWANVALLIFLPPERHLKKSLAQVLTCVTDASNSMGFFTITGPDKELESPSSSAHAKPGQPVELVFLYQAALIGSDTRLTHQLKNLDPEGLVLEKYIEQSSDLMHSFGPFSADMMWQDLADHSADLFSKLPRALELIRHAGNPVHTVTRKGERCNITSKIATLLDLIEAHFEVDVHANFILWVRFVYTANALKRILSSCKMQFGQLRATVMHGHGSFAQHIFQESLVEEFLKGQWNILIVTPSTDDLALPPATCIVRLDIVDSIVSYSSSLACASLSGAHLIQLAERDNGEHRRIMEKFSTMDPGMRRWALTTRSLCSSPPPPALRETIFVHHLEDENEACIMDPTTSARIHKCDALQIVYQMAANLHIGGTSDRQPQPLFTFELIQRKSTSGVEILYVCEISMPSSSSLPSRTFKGAASDSMPLARRTACYELCQSLLRHGVLDFRLFPSNNSMERASARSDLSNYPATSVHQTNSRTDRVYSRKTPDFWKNSREATKDRLHATVLLILGVEKDHFHPLLFLTHFPLPPISPIRLFLQGSAGETRFNPVGYIELSQIQVDMLHQYTERLFRLVTNRAITCNAVQSVYYVAPLRHRQGNLDFRKPSGELASEGPRCPIHWDLVSSTLEAIAVPLRKPEFTAVDLQNSIIDCVLQERPGEFTRRYEARQLCETLSPQSLVPLDAGGDGRTTFLEETSLQRKEAIHLQNPNERMIEARRILPVSNHISPPSTSEGEIDEKRYFIPELAYRLTIPASVMRSALLLPSILRRLDDILLVKELNGSLFNHRLPERQLQAAITASSAMMDFDYERLELLGDTFLKYFSSAFLFVSAPYQAEGVMHLLRQKLVSNVTLCGSAIRSGLPEYAQTKKLVPKYWKPYSDGRHHIEGEQPENVHGGGMVIPGQKPDTLIPSPGERNTKKRGTKGVTEATTHHLNDKCIADMVEAIIGAALASHGREEALWVAKRLSLPIAPSITWDELGRQAALIPVPDTVKPLSPGSLQEVERIVGHKFAQPLLLAQALTHHTVHDNCGTASCYERLEFIGDAILDFLTVCYIFEAYPESSPGTLSLLKSSMVANSTLAALCVHLGLHKHLVFSSANVKREIDNYVSALLNLRERESSQEGNEGQPQVPFWLDAEAPKLLSDVVESILGAMFVDERSRILGSELFFQKALKPFVTQHIDIASLGQHPTNTLYEYFQAKGCQKFRITKAYSDSSECNAVASALCHDVVLSKVSDVTPQAAARKCSLLVLDALRETPGILDVCDCNQPKDRRKRARVDD